MLRLVTAPTSEPITTASLKSSLSIASGITTFDTKIDDCIKAARCQFETDASCIQVLPATWMLLLDSWPGLNEIFGCHVLLNKFPLTAISSIKYYAEGEVALTTMAPTDYSSDLYSFPGRIKFISDTLPTLNDDLIDKIQITFTCGWTSAAVVPADIIQAIKLLAGHYFENPQQVMTGTQVNELPMGYNQIVSNYTLKWI